MIITGIDFETTGLLSDGDPRIVGVGMSMFDVTGSIPGTNRCKIETEAFSIKATSFIVSPGDVPFKPEAIEVHGVTPEIAKKWGRPEREALIEVVNWMEVSEFMCAFNGNGFDKVVLSNTAERLGRTLPTVPWIDAHYDLEHEYTDDLAGTCAKHGFLMLKTHDALADVTAMMQLVFKHDIARVTALAASPPITLMAEVSYDEKDLAKKRNYKWHDKKDPRMPETWALETREMFLQQEIDEAPFGLWIEKEGEWKLLRRKLSSHAGVVEI